MPYFERDGVTIYHGDCREILPSLPNADLVVADPPYGMGKESWDSLIDPATWLPLARANALSTAVFCGVRGLFDYPRPDWTMAWVRLASTQRNGKFRGFNNWEPILVYGCTRPSDLHRLHISNDVVSVQNIPDASAAAHPTPKPVRLLSMLLRRLETCHAARRVIDPFMGSGTTLLAARDLGMKAIGIEICEQYCEIAAKRLAQRVFTMAPAEDAEHQQRRDER